MGEKESFRSARRTTSGERPREPPMTKTCLFPVRSDSESSDANASEEQALPSMHRAMTSSSSRMRRSSRAFLAHHALTVRLRGVGRLRQVGDLRLFDAAVARQAFLVFIRRLAPVTLPQFADTQDHRVH